MTDNGLNFNHIKSAGALLLAALIVLGSVLTVAAAAAVPAEKAEIENNVANSMVYNNLTDDGTFHVLSAHEVSVKNNGVIKKIVVSGGTVADALNQAGVKLGENQISVPSASTEIKSDTDIVILNAKKVSLTADGKTQNVLLPYGKVGESIILAGIRLSQDDILSVDCNTKVDDISELSIKRVIYKNVSVTEAVPFESKKENSDEIDLGDSKLKTKGVDGEKLVTKRVKYIDGEKDDEKVISEKITKKPVDEVTLVGTKGAASAGGAGTFTDENGVKVSYSYKLTGSGTAYTAPAGALTASGHEVYEGGVAVNPALIPYGSKLYIETTDGIFSYGYATAIDTGGALMDGSAIVDLFYFSLDDCYSFGRRDVNVYVL
ncbi:G5 domain-containing protein [Ruminococcus sp. JL13D9]|uniref:G5 domain-containing protein n=1 Tax=Ruminococcus sp. JL13D9 TaxID=3233381 RepID=UPI003899AE12